MDFFRLTSDAWQFTLEGFSHRFLYKNKDQPCIFCRNSDCGFVPRAMQKRIRYWNLWMTRILHPELVAVEPRRGVRKVPMCMREGGYVYTPVYVPLVAITCTLIWIGFILWFLCLTDIIPPEVRESFFNRDS